MSERLETIVRADRLLSILLLLQTRRRMTARELARRLEVSERTIYRDVAALGSAGIPILTERGHAGGVALLDGYRTNLTGMTGTEARTLVLSGAPNVARELGQGQLLEGALLKLLAALPAAQRDEAERARQRVHIDTARWNHGEEPVPLLRAVQDAAWADEVLRIRYRRAAHDEVERVVEPYGLVVKAGIWYMVARVREDGAGGEDGAHTSERQMRSYRVSRIASVEPAGERFERPAGFDLATWWRQQSADFLANLPRYPATLRVSPAGRDIIPMLMGERARRLLEAAPIQPDGWATMEYPFDTFESARGVMLSLGTLAEVIAPAELRAGVARMAAEIAAFYGAGTTTRDGQSE